MQTRYSDKALITTNVLWNAYCWDLNAEIYSEFRILLCIQKLYKLLIAIIRIFLKVIRFIV